MQYDFLSSLLMSVCESVPIWQLEKLPHSCKDGCYGKVDLMSCVRCCVIRMEKSVEVKLSLVKWCVASYIFQLNAVNHLITIDRVKGAMHDNMLNVLRILSTVTHMSVNKIKRVKMRLKIIVSCFGPNESCFMIRG